MHPGQFTIKRLFVSTALVAVGCIGFSLWMPGRYRAIDSELVQIITITFGWACGVWMGAGIGHLFNHWKRGARIGAIAQVVILFYMFRRH
jgi:hypothetical protein